MEMNTLRRLMQKDYKSLKSWQSVADKWGLKKGTAYKIARYPDYEPKDYHIRQYLNLPALVEIAPCAKCGEIHLPKRCPNNSGPGKPQSKKVSLGHVTPEENIVIMSIKPEIRKQAILNEAWSLPFEELEERFRMVTGGLSNA